ncbi:MAG: desaturase [Rhodospirillaceae bacterium]|nr:desaturase [Rhodospirillaceae bacterium]|tara:strand:+ start:185 stop:1192 length:1008 start_codon:yes stop_codon:yes gene_type:complete
MSIDKVISDQSVDSGIWNHHPNVPIQTGGIVRNISNPLAFIKAIIFSWFGLYVRGPFLVIICILWVTLFPAMETIKLNNDLWFLKIFTINILMMITWAGGLHLFFYRFSCQGKYLQFSMNVMQKGPRYTFGDQVYDNMFWTLAFGVPIWTIYECGLLWLLAMDFTPSNSWSDGPTWFVLFFILIPFWDSSHFYVIHRLLHTKWFYRRFHSVHHRNINVGPWSGLSMHPIESAIYLSPVIVHFFLPSHPLHIIFHITWYALGPAATHCGFEAISIKGIKYPRLGDFFHVLHHKFFECNYGNSEVPLDKIGGSFHDGTRKGTKEIRTKMKKAGAAHT